MKGITELDRVASRPAVTVVSGSANAILLQRPQLRCLFFALTLLLPQTAMTGK